MAHLNILSAAEVASRTNSRPGETKLGETVQTLSAGNWQQELVNSSAPMVLLGIPEDIGVRANHGQGGAASLWEPALGAILNVQETDRLQGSRLLVLGAFDFSTLGNGAGTGSVTELREQVSRIDDVVFPVIKAIADAGKVPVVIGGGHNNVYPILKGLSRALNQSVNCINLDAHCDYRPIEGRHSGNGFRYARMDGYLKRYAVVGLHRNYNSQPVLNELQADADIHYSFYEDIFLENKHSFEAAVDDAIRFTAGAPAGIDIDLDCIEGVLSSAATPCGLTPLQARSYLAKAVTLADVRYLHLTEGCAHMPDGRTDALAAKLVAYLVTDFLRGMTNKQRVFIRETEI